MKIVFLDFDGPIIPAMSHTTRRAAREKAWPACVSALNRITDSTGAMIVVSSSWRCSGLKDMRYLLTAWGVTGNVVAITPRIENTERGHEIQAWLDSNPAESFVILDDDEDMVHLAPYLIRTPFEEGLTEEDADRAIAMLAPKATISASEAPQVRMDVPS